MQSKEFNYGGKKIQYRVAGNGPLVVLLHGFGEDGAIWKGQYSLFPEHKLLVPDLPGTGNSEAIADNSMEGFAAVINALVDAEASTSATVTLIGHSMGGYITLAFAEKYPERLRAFGLFHSTSFADSEEKKETRRKSIRFIRENSAAAFIRSSTPNMYAPQTREQHPEWVDEHLSTAHNFLADSLVNYYEAMIARPDRTDVLKKAAVPVLFVLGQHDAAVLLKDGLKQCYLPRIAYIHLLEQSGHMGMIEELNNANKILSQFVTSIEKTA